jgi:hypothetical protein
MTVAAAEIQSTKPPVPNQPADGSPVDLSLKRGLHFG